MTPGESSEPQAREESGDASTSPLEVLEEISLDDVFALRHEGTEPVDWAALVPDRSGTCPDCGRTDGPRHHKQCMAHPRPPSMWWPVGATLGLTLPLTLVAGPGALLFFVPLLALAFVIRAR